MRILGFAGKIGSGKDSAARFILGHVLQQRKVIKKFDIDNSGNLLVNYAVKKDGGYEEGMGIFDVERVDAPFVSYLESTIWPHCKLYSIADNLKWIVVNLYGIEYEKIFGTQAQKNEDSKYLWGDIYDIIPKAVRPAKIDKKALMTNRQFVQHLSDVLKYIDNECFIKSLMQQIMLEQCPFSIITDVRYEHEIDMIHQCGGRVIKLLRETENDKHQSECSLDAIDNAKFDSIIDNRFCNIVEKNTMLHTVVNEWGWI